jgi:hypothetical protein
MENVYLGLVSIHSFISTHIKISSYSLYLLQVIAKIKFQDKNDSFLLYNDENWKIIYDFTIQYSVNTKTE